MPHAARAKNRMLARPTPPMASGPSGPTISVSTMPIAIQPISARMTGQARRPSGRSSLRHEAAMRGVVGTAVDIRRSYPAAVAARRHGIVRLTARPPTLQQERAGADASAAGGDQPDPVGGDDGDGADAHPSRAGGGHGRPEARQPQREDRGRVEQIEQAEPRTAIAASGLRNTARSTSPRLSAMIVRVTPQVGQGSPVSVLNTQRGSWMPGVARATPSRQREAPPTRSQSASWSVSSGSSRRQVRVTGAWSYSIAPAVAAEPMISAMIAAVAAGTSAGSRGRAARRWR